MLVALVTPASYGKRDVSNLECRKGNRQPNTRIERTIGVGILVKEGQWLAPLAAQRPCLDVFEATCGGVNQGHRESC